jgi:hypothetical protein
MEKRHWALLSFTEKRSIAEVRSRRDDRIRYLLGEEKHVQCQRFLIVEEIGDKL